MGGALPRNKPLFCELALEVIAIRGRGKNGTLRLGYNCHEPLVEVAGLSFVPASGGDEPRLPVAVDVDRPAPTINFS